MSTSRAYTDRPEVDRLVVQADRAKLADDYEKRLARIATLARQITSSPSFMGWDDIADLHEILELAERK